MPRHIDYTNLNYSQFSLIQRFTRALVKGLMRLLLRVTVEGVENCPPQGAFLMAVNHLHLFDSPVIYCLFPRRLVAFAADKWQRVPVIGWLIDRAGDAIWVARGEADRQALKHALTVLRAGGVVGIAPEGTRSRTGGLTKGHAGVAYLATRAPAPVLPVVAYGQEKAFAYWKRLRRPPVWVRFGQPIHLPHGKVSGAQLEELTDQLMLALADLLPPEYRGVYGEKVP